MADIFLSYAREDLAKAKRLAAALEKQGWSVFWDRTALLAGQDIDEVIEQAIEQARCMIVAWSKISKKSDWVRGEAEIGRQRKILVPVLFEPVEPPIAFRSLHTENLANWQGKTDASEYSALCKAVDRLVVGPTPTPAASSVIPDNKPENIIKSQNFWRNPLTAKAGKIGIVTAAAAITLWLLPKLDLNYKEQAGQATAGAAIVAADDDSAKQPGKSTETRQISAASTETAATADTSEKIGQRQARVAAPAIDKTPVNEPQMAMIPAGSFMMGSDTGEMDEKPVHRVTVPAFSIGVYEVTFEQYDQFAKATSRELPRDKGWGRGTRPVITVSWYDAADYAAWLSEKTGKHYHLPSEAQWEYAARAGSTGDYYWHSQDEAKNFAWFDDNAGSTTHPVGEKKPNAFGLYDMSGNVREWVRDCYQENYNQAPEDGAAWVHSNQDPEYDAAGVQGYCWRVLRGGSWYDHLSYLRSADRDGYGRGTLSNNVGFRLAQD